MDDTVLEEISWAKMILLHQDKVGYRGIGIVEVLWKVFSVVVNCCLKSSVVLREALHEFIERKGTVTATLQAIWHSIWTGLRTIPSSVHSWVYAMPMTHWVGSGAWNY